MKVLVLSHMYPCTANEAYGIFVHEQARALVANGIEVQVISPTAGTPWPVPHLSRKWREISRIPQKAEWEGISVSYPRYRVLPRALLFSSSGRRMHRGICGLVRQLRKNFTFDLIHAHVALPDGYAGALLGQQLRVPLVVTIHGQDLHRTVHRSARCKRALGFTIRQASQVIVVSKKLKRLAEKHFGAEFGLRVIGNGVNVTSLVEAGPEDASVGQGRPLLLSVSNLVETKGIDLNLCAMARLRQKHRLLHYRVVGGGPLESRLRRMVSSLGLGDCVEFLGLQPHRRVMEYMAECDVFSLPSWREGFGVVYLEAMASGKPVIGCQGEGIEDFVEQGQTGMLVRPRDVDSLVDALDFLLTHPEEAHAMGERARKVVLENHTWEKNAEKTIQVYREVLGEC